MKIIISGYGKMGHEIEKISSDYDHIITAKINTLSDWKKYDDSIRNSEVVIDFSQPDVVIENIKRCFDANIPIVVGTTGWDGHKLEIKQYCLTNRKSIFVASNFSIGVNIFYEINKKLAKIMNQYPSYDISIEEIHHIHKKDKPSGTAVQIASQIIENISRVNQWKSEDTDQKDIIPVKSARHNDVPGTHVVKYSSTIDEIEIIHSAKNRTGFAMGAIRAAEWLVSRTGFFEMKDLLGINE